MERKREEDRKSRSVKWERDKLDGINERETDCVKRKRKKVQYKKIEKNEKVKREKERE